MHKTIHSWLAAKQGKQYRYKMEKIRYALELLDHPERRLTCIHVAGTNGKGSTVAFLRVLLQSQGLRVGCFVSPHMVTVHDRITIDQVPISDADFQELGQEIYQLESIVQERYEDRKSVV